MEPGQAPLSMEFSRQEYWNGLPFAFPGNLLDPGAEPGSPALQADSLPSEPLGKHQLFLIHFLRQFQKEHHISYYFLEEKLKYFRILQYFRYFKILKGIQPCFWFPPAFHVGRYDLNTVIPPSMTKNPFLLNLFYFLWFRIPPLRTKCFDYMILSPQHSIRGGIIIHLLLMSRLYIT